MYMKDSAKKAKLNPRDLDKLDWEYDRPQREKIRRRRRKHDDEELPNRRTKNGKKRQKS